MVLEGHREETVHLTLNRGDIRGHDAFQDWNPRIDLEAGALRVRRRSKQAVVGGPRCEEPLEADQQVLRGEAHLETETKGTFRAGSRGQIKTEVLIRLTKTRSYFCPYRVMGQDPMSNSEGTLNTCSPPGHMETET